MKRMLTAEQIKKAENNCATFFPDSGVPRNEIPTLFVPHTKKIQYWSSSKKLELRVEIDFTDCLTGCRYVLDWYNTSEDDELKEMYPGLTWAEAINEEYDIEEIDLTVRIYGLKSGIEFSMPSSFFALESNRLRGGSSIYLATKDEDKETTVPISAQYNEYREETVVHSFTSYIDGNWNSADDIPLDLLYRFKTAGPVVYSTWGY